MNKEYKCEFCDKIYSNRSGKKNLEKHIIYCISNPNRVKYKCNSCFTEFDKRHALIGHKSKYR
jgi:DNA-directed RNA polymerase subunit RPC12/RpoP